MSKNASLCESDNENLMVSYINLQVYNEMLARYKKLEEQVAAEYEVK